MTAATAESLVTLASGLRKHAFAARALLRHREHRPDLHKTARQRAFCPSRRLRRADEIASAGDDPVNEADPTGLSSQLPTLITLGCGRTVGTSPYGIDLVMNWRCAQAVLTWELSFDPAVLPFIDGPVTETGMAWYLNGRFRKRGVEHVRMITTPSDNFHGKFAPVKLNDEIGMDDILRWDMITGPDSLALATATITARFKLAKEGVKGFIMEGPITASGVYTGLNDCGPGSPVLAA